MRQPVCDCGHDVAAHRMHAVNGWCASCSCTGFPDEHPGPRDADGLPLPVFDSLADVLFAPR